ncbi:multidrug efflux SMR transporter [Helicobacter sp. MIT 99-10781]|uniref:DMT family transporter n=1 Tax=Helicobacter sp. MIT 99-10781 TaxID=1332285 RepID=UPI002161186A|nr:multidrug efflux SMR transporter [Helicobacter sp. MIT 99-10781]
MKSLKIPAHFTLILLYVSLKISFRFIFVLESATLQITIHRRICLQTTNNTRANLNTNKAWILIILGGIVECFWVSGLKYADSFALYILTGAGILFSFCAMLIACRKVEVSIAYSVFVGIGAAGVVLFEIFIFGEEFSWIKLALIALLLVGIIGLKIVSKEQTSEDSKLVNELNENLGLDEVSQKL